MLTAEQRYELWEPIPALPEAPLTEFGCRFDAGHLIVEAQYSFADQGCQLVIEFEYVEAFKVYEEFSDPWMGTGIPLPQVKGEHERWCFPLQEVFQSEWIARVMQRNGGIERWWHHYVISTMDCTLHVMTGEPPKRVALRSE
jgi:hypothetical protein